MSARVTLAMTAFQFDGSNDEEILTALNEECGLVSMSPSQLVVYGMDNQQYTIPQGDYFVIDANGWPAGRAMTAEQYQAKYTEIVPPASA